MPSLLEESGGISWADQVEQNENPLLPQTQEEFDRNTGIKKITEYKQNEDNKLVKIVKHYKIEKKLVPKAIARRKEWKKFGAAENDPPGPNSSNTIMSEEIGMQFINSREIQTDVEEDAMSKLKTTQKIVQCRICKGDHWTTKCPYKDTLAPLQEKLQEDTKNPADAAAPGAAAAAAGPKTGKYVPPSLREGATRGRGESAPGSQKRDETATIRVTNLSEDTRESDLQELFRPFGPIQRIYLAKDKITGQSKGFAFINFYRREDAARAISGVSGFGYDHLILNVEWAKPSGNT